MFIAKCTNAERIIFSESSPYIVYACVHISYLEKEVRLRTQSLKVTYMWTSKRISFLPYLFAFCNRRMVFTERLLPKCGYLGIDLDKTWTTFAQMWVFWYRFGQNKGADGTRYGSSNAWKRSHRHCSGRWLLNPLQWLCHQVIAANKTEDGDFIVLVENSKRAQNLI